MKSFKFRNITSVLLLVVVLMCVGYYMLFSFITTKNRVIADTSIGREARLKQESAVSSLKGAITSSQADIDRIKNYFISNEGAVSFIEYLEDLGREVGVEVVIQDVKESDVSSKQELRFRLATQGSWKAVYRFLGSLENIPYVVTLEQVEVRKTLANEFLVVEAFQARQGVETKKVAGAWRGDFEFTVLKNK